MCKLEEKFREVISLSAHVRVANEHAKGFAEYLLENYFMEETHIESRWKDFHGNYFTTDEVLEKYNSETY